jgi:branched-chain amino acid transport system ATP-binding protein
MALPELLMLDEPSLGLAPLMVSSMFCIAEEINRVGTTILLVERNVYHALRMSHRAYVMENGSIVLQGKGDNLFRNPLMREAYLGL